MRKRMYNINMIYASRHHAAIIKNSAKAQWYEKYRVEDEDELEKANDIWKDIV